MLKENQKAPVFTLPSSEGEDFKLSDYKNKKNVVIYFYPKDNTPGCTTQACDIRDNYKTILKHDAIIVGISADSLKKHDNFISKYKLPFPLLSDEDTKVCEKYGVWVEKSMYGKKYMGIERSTFIVGKDGKLKAVFRKVKPKEHVAQVLEVLENL